MSAADRYAKEVGPEGPDMASAVFSVVSALCSRLGPNVCPFRASLRDGKCPAKVSPCPHAPDAADMPSQRQIKERRGIGKGFDKRAAEAAPSSARRF